MALDCRLLLPPTIDFGPTTTKLSVRPSSVLLSFISGRFYVRCSEAASEQTSGFRSLVIGLVSLSPFWEGRALDSGFTLLAGLGFHLEFGDVVDLKMGYCNQRAHCQRE